METASGMVERVGCSHSAFIVLHPEHANLFGSTDGPNYRIYGLSAVKRRFGELCRSLRLAVAVVIVESYTHDALRILETRTQLVQPRRCLVGLARAYARGIALKFRNQPSLPHKAMSLDIGMFNSRSPTTKTAFRGDQSG